VELAGDSFGDTMEPGSPWSFGDWGSPAFVGGSLAGVARVSATGVSATAAAAVASAARAAGAAGDLIRSICVGRQSCIATRLGTVDGLHVVALIESAAVMRAFRHDPGTKPGLCETVEPLSHYFCLLLVASLAIRLVRLVSRGARGIDFWIQLELLTSKRENPMS